MRHIIIAVLLAGVATPVLAQQPGTAIDVRVTTSRLLGLLEFTLGASGNAGGASVFRRHVAASKVAGLETDAVRHLAELDLGVYNYTYDGYPATHGQTVGALGFFRMAAAKAHGWEDLRDRTAGYFANEVQNTVIQAMRDAEPAYDSLIWRPYGAVVQQQSDSLASYVASRDLGSVADRLATFYGAAWPRDLPIWAALHPFPPRAGLTAAVFGNVAVSGMAPGFRDYAMYTSIVLHELSHQLFAQQPRGLAHTIRGTMLAGASPSRMLAYRWLDEALATAAANGWSYKALTGALDTSSWYDNRIIDGYARALYPRVAEYIEAGRTIDDEFLRDALSMFQATFPKAVTDPDAVFPFMSLVTNAEGGEMNTLLAPLYERHRLRGVVMTNRFDDQTLAAVFDAPALAVVLVTKPSTGETALLRKHLPAEMVDAEEDAVFMVTDKGQPLLLLRVDNPETLRRVLDQTDAEGLMSLSHRLPPSLGPSHLTSPAPRR